MSVELIFGAISGIKKLVEAFRGKPLPPQVDQVITAGKGLHDAIKAGVVKTRDERGVELTPEQFEAKFVAWEAAQLTASQGAAERLERRQRGDGTGEP